MDHAIPTTVVVRNTQTAARTRHTSGAQQTIVTTRTKTATSPIDAPKEQHEGKTVLATHEYDSALEHIIQRDYFPTSAETAATTTPAPSSLTAFHAIATNRDSVAFSTNHACSLTEQQQRQSQRYGNGVERNALFFPATKSTTILPSAKNVHETTEVKVNTHTHRPKIAAVATRFPVPTFDDALDSNNNYGSMEHHWEGLDEDELDSNASTNLDETVVRSIRSEIREGERRRRWNERQLRIRKDVHVAAGGGADTTVGLFRLPPASSRDQRAGDALRQTRLRVRDLQRPDQQQPKKRPKIGSSHSQSHQRVASAAARKRPPSVRSGDSFGWALRAAYTPKPAKVLRKRRRTGSSVPP